MSKKKKQSGQKIGEMVAKAHEGKPADLVDEFSAIAALAAKSQEATPDPVVRLALMFISSLADALAAEYVIRDIERERQCQRPS